MIKKLITLFKIGRKLALSDALNIISRIYTWGKLAIDLFAESSSKTSSARFPLK